RNGLPFGSVKVNLISAASLSFEDSSLVEASSVPPFRFPVFFGAIVAYLARYELGGRTANAPSPVVSSTTSPSSSVAQRRELAGTLSQLPTWSLQLLPSKDSINRPGEGPPS